MANTHPVNDAERDIASLEPKVPEIFERSLPDCDEIEEDIFRRYRDKEKPTAKLKPYA